MTCLMMDATMILLKLVGFVPSSGVVIDVCAYCPWVTRDGHKGMDSCCIALINCPGVHRFDSSRAETKAIKLPSRVQDNQLKEHQGYGQFLSAYHPKDDNKEALKKVPGAVVRWQVAEHHIARASTRAIDGRIVAQHDSVWDSG